MSNIIVLGSSNMDMVVKSSRLPKPGETILGGTFLMNPGGKGANQAIAVARLGGKVRFISKIGNDIFGKQLLELYKSEGIDTATVLTDMENITGVALITVDANAENCIVVASGANASLSKDDIMLMKYCFKDCDFLLMQLETPLDTILYASMLAKENGIKTILNPAPAQQLPDSLLSSLYMITPNKTEAEMLSGLKITDKNSVKVAAEIIAAKGVENVIVTLGSEGAYVREENESYFVEACEVKAIDTTAAGDTFNGALCTALAEGFSIRQAAKFASKAASISVMRMGALDSVPYRYELAGLY